MDYPFGPLPVVTRVGRIKLKQQIKENTVSHACIIKSSSKTEKRKPYYSLLLLFKKLSLRKKTVNMLNFSPLTKKQ